MFEHEKKGGGSAFGGKWKPKKEEDERFIGTPGEIKVSYTRHGEKKLTKIGDDGYAIRERHFSVHSHPNVHTNPHNHVIDWSKNYPNPGKPINYYDEVPEFKNYGDVFMSNKDIFIDDSDRFESISDFKYALICGREVEFEWNGIKYGAFHEGEGDKEFFLCEAYNPDGTLKKGFTDVRSAYHCRDAKKHTCYDRLALLKCSQNLGHNRASIVADHYLWS